MKRDEIGTANVLNDGKGNELNLRENVRNRVNVQRKNRISFLPTRSGTKRSKMMTAVLTRRMESGASRCTRLALGTGTLTRNES